MVKHRIIIREEVQVELRVRLQDGFETLFFRTGYQGILVCSGRCPTFFVHDVDLTQLTRIEFRQPSPRIRTVHFNPPSTS